MALGKWIKWIKGKHGHISNAETDYAVADAVYDAAYAGKPMSIETKNPKKPSELFNYQIKLLELLAKPVWPFKESIIERTTEARFLETNRPAAIGIILRLLSGQLQLLAANVDSSTEKLVHLTISHPMVHFGEYLDITSQEAYQLLERLGTFILEAAEIARKDSES
jgi:hypothetical protein